MDIDFGIQPITPTFKSAALALNNAHAAELSWLTPAQLSSMIAQAFYAARIGDVDAILIAFDQSADYESPNFLWFQERFARFVYIDRIAVAESARGRGLARRLYGDLFERASAAGHSTVCCEVNSLPPNPASDAFHTALGFSEAGAAIIHGGAKSVRYFVRPLP